MRVWLVVLLGAIGVASCRGDGQHATPDGREFPHVTAMIDRHAPTSEELAGLRYEGLAGGAVTLTGGAWTGRGGERVEIARDVTLAGDITGNGTDEAVVLLRQTRPGTAARLYAAVVGSADGHVSNLATVALGDDVTAMGGRVELGRFSVEVTRPAPALPARLTFTYDRGVLRLAEEESLAAPPSAR